MMVFFYLAVKNTTDYPTQAARLPGRHIYTNGPLFSTTRGRRLWVPGLQRRFGVSHHDNLMTAWSSALRSRTGNHARTRYVVSFAGPFVS